MSNIIHLNRTTGDVTLGQLAANGLLALDSDKVVSSVGIPTDGNVIVGDGSGWVAESGNTARTSLGLGTGDSPEFTELTLNDTTYGGIALSPTWGGTAITTYFGGDIAACTSQTFSRSRGTASSPSTITDNDWISKWRFTGYNGASFEQFGGFVFDVPDVSGSRGRFNFYYYDGAARYIFSTDKTSTKIGDADGTDYVQISSTTGDLSFAGSASFLPPRVSQSAQPTPDVGALVVWRDPDDNKTYLVYNDTDEGVRKVEMT